MTLLIPWQPPAADRLHRLVVVDPSNIVVLSEGWEAQPRITGLPSAASIPKDIDAVVTLPALLSVNTVADVLGCHPRTVRRRIDEGVLPAVSMEAQLRVRGDDLRCYIDGLQQRGPEYRRTQTRRGPRGWSGL